MELISTRVSTKGASPTQQGTQRIHSDPTLWQAFFEKCTPCERKQFLRNMHRHFSQIIARHLRKSKESMEKIKDSYR